MASVAVLGASGYAGAIAAMLVDRHPHFTLRHVTARSEAGKRLDDLHPRTVRLPAIVVRPYVVLIGEESDPVLSDEVAASFWVPLSALREGGGWRDTVVTAGGLEFTRRAFHHGGFVVWGMTERLVSRLLALLDDSSLQ